MGIAIQSLGDSNNGTPFKPLYMDKQVFMWFVGRRDPVPRADGKGHDWHIQGIFTTERLAVDVCLDENYFIGPLPVDMLLPHDVVQWPGHYFPLLVAPSDED